VRYTGGMTAKSYPTDLPDAAWDCIKEVIPPLQPGGRHRELAMRAVVHAIFSGVDGDRPWRLLPQEAPKWPRVSWECSPWRARGDWHRLHDPRCAHGRQQAGRHQHPTAGGLDSPSVTPTALGGERGYERGTKGHGRQGPLRVDTLGLRMAVVVTAAAVSDPAAAHLRCAPLGGACKKLRLLGVEGGSRGHLVAWVAQHRRCRLRVTLWPEGWQGFGRLPRRWVVERTLAGLTQSRRVRQDSARLPKSSEAMLSLSMTRLMLRRLAAA